MSEHAGTDPRTAAAEQAATRDATGAPDQTQVAEDPTGEAAAYGGIADDAIGEPDELN
ncbi:MAG TPA: hypothetical protein VFQ85_10470 [Mycobacteriales bacterium]|jgi:hypothetical protein|nr:hypothetical protein [Mycobacteriales bacterium]